MDHRNRLRLDRGFKNRKPYSQSLIPVLINRKRNFKIWFRFWLVHKYLLNPSLLNQIELSKATLELSLGSQTTTNYGASNVGPTNVTECRVLICWGCIRICWLIVVTFWLTGAHTTPPEYVVEISRNTVLFHHGSLKRNEINSYICVWRQHFWTISKVGADITIYVLFIFIYQNIQILQYCQNLV